MHVLDGSVAHPLQCVSLRSSLFAFSAITPALPWSPLPLDSSPWKVATFRDEGRSVSSTPILLDHVVFGEEANQDFRVCTYKYYSTHKGRQRIFGRWPFRQPSLVRLCRTVRRRIDFSRKTAAELPPSALEKAETVRSHALIGEGLAGWSCVPTFAGCDLFGFLFMQVSELLKPTSHKRQPSI